MEKTILNPEKVTARTLSEQSWKSHIVRSLEFAGSDGEYCRQNNLSPSTFRAHKTKLGLTRPRRARRSSFVKLDRDGLTQKTDAPVLRSLTTPLPDARWTAEFVAALMAACR